MGKNRRGAQRRSMSPMMAQLLVLASRYVRVCGSPDGYVHLGDFLNTMCARGHIAGKPGGDYAKLKHWLLVRKKLGGSAPGRRRSGMWQILDAGHTFADAQSCVWLYVWIRGDEAVGRSDATVDVITAVGGDDEYRRLLEVEFGPGAARERSDAH